MNLNGLALSKLHRKRSFAGYGLTEKPPHHSSLILVRQRWGEIGFRRVFERTVVARVAAGIAKGEVVHVVRG